MTAQHLFRLIETHRWLAQELADQSGAGAEINRRHIRRELDSVFLKIVRFPSEHPQICCAQIEFLLGSLSESGQDDKSRAALCAVALQHLERLSVHLDKAAPASRKHSRAQKEPAAARQFVRTGSA